MFKLKKKVVDRYIKPGSYVGVIFTMKVIKKKDLYWRILSYDEHLGYVRSNATEDLSSYDMSVPYEISRSTHSTIRDLVRKGSWKIYKNYGV